MYRIIYWNEDHDLEVIKEEEGIVGVCDYNKREIHILDKGQHRLEIADTLIHEILHAIAEAFSIKSIHEKEDEEDTVASLAKGLLSVLHDNKLAFWLSKKDRSNL